MIRENLVDGLTLASCLDDHELCTGCAYGKNHQASSPLNEVRHKAANPGDLIHSDICGPMSVDMVSGTKFYSPFKDDATGYRVIYCMAKKSEVLTCFQKFVSQLERDTKSKVSILRSDRGGEYTSHAFNAFFQKKGIKQELTTTYIPKMNGVAERDNHTIMESVYSMIYTANVHFRF